MICNRGEILAGLGKLGNMTAAQVMLIDMLHKEAERAVKKFVRYSVEQATFTEYYPFSPHTSVRDDLTVEDAPVSYWGDYLEHLRLTELPVRSITTINETYTEGGGGWPAGTLLLSTDYYVLGKNPAKSMSGLISRRSGYWSQVPQSIRVVYVAGYTAAELADEACHFKAAVRMETARRFRETETLFDQAGGLAGQGPLVREKFVDWEQEFHMEVSQQLLGHSTALCREARELLQDDRRLG